MQNLIRYQDFSLQMARLQALLQQFPIQIQAIDDEVKASAGAVDAAKAALGDHQKERRRLDGELQDWETKLKKYNDQLMQVKTNDEYRAMQHEIATVKEKVGGVEEKILMLMEESETGERRVKQEQARLEELRRQGEARKSLVLQEKSQVEAEAAAVSAEQESARTALDPTILEMFDRIARGRNGVAMAQAREERCQGCRVRMRPSVFQEIKRNERIIQCDSCRRILYYVAEAPAPEPPAA